MKQFDKVFRAALDELEAEANAIGETITSVCRRAKVSRTTPDRWRKEVPTSIKAFVSLQEALEELKKEKGESSTKYKPTPRRHIVKVAEKPPSRLAVDATPETSEHSTKKAKPKAMALA